MLYHRLLLPLQLPTSHIRPTSPLSSLVLALAFILNWKVQTGFLLHSQTRKAARGRVLCASFMLRQSPSCQPRTLEWISKNSRSKLRASHLGRQTGRYSSPSSMYSILLTMSKLSTAGAPASAGLVPVRIRPGGPGNRVRGAGRTLAFSQTSSQLFLLQHGLGISGGISENAYTCSWCQLTVWKRNRHSNGGQTANYEKDKVTTHSLNCCRRLRVGSIYM